MLQHTVMIKGVTINWALGKMTVITIYIHVSQLKQKMQLVQTVN